MDVQGFIKLGGFNLFVVIVVNNIYIVKCILVWVFSYLQ